MTTPTTEPPEQPRRRSRLSRWVPVGLRARIIAGFIAVLAVATISFVLVTAAVLDIRVDQRVDAELVQEAAELRRLAAGNDPATGEPFGGRVRRIFEVFLRRNVPSRNEALITFVDGRPFLRSRAVLPYRLDRDPELVARWASLTRTDRGRVQTPAGRVEYLALPLRAGEATAGVFVAAIFRDRTDDDIEEAVVAAGAVGVAVLLLGSLLAWRLADRVVKPVAELTQTARAISESDLGRRIPERGSDEVAQLAATFNDMLDRLEGAFGSQRRFIDDAGHELRTPITIVRGHLELIEDEPHARAETIALVLDELDRMSRIVDDLLLLSKREQPDFLALETVDVGALTDELHVKVAALASVPWELESRGRGVIVADRQRLTQAVVQLAQNAVQHGPPGEPIALGSSVLDGTAAFWVRDSGPAIPADVREVIFERFRRAAAGPRSEGAGLGLAIVKAIAEAHDGRVELDSAPGAGTTFRIVVPVDPPSHDLEER
ncbi:MAG TPA: HAMP domain-containing sensor histidine kinase [Gaiellaceae bacterium]|nr:HAMP domain-containing sensor histidine kinase [Gaiellaceae bacterium]